MATYEEWSRHNKSLYEKYVYEFSFEINGRKIALKQENVFQAEDLVRLDFIIDAN
jgi:hypothetical protein